MLKKQEKILLIGSSLWYFGEGMLGPLFAIFAEHIGGSILDITWAWATYLFVLGILVIIVGRFSDRLNKEKVMMVGYVLNAVFTFTYLLIETPAQLFILQAGFGLATALSVPTWLSLYDKYSGDDNDGFIWGLESGSASIVTAFAIVIGGLIVNYFSFKTLFFTMGCVQVLAVVYQARILKTPNLLEKSV